MGAALTVLGVLTLLFEPVGAVGGCADFTDRAGVCREQGAYSWWGLINWPAGWEHKLFVPMSIIGLALVVTGIVLLIKPRRSRSAV